MVGQLSKMGMHQLLRRSKLGRIGCSNGNQVYVVPVNYVFDGQSIICQSLEGRKIRMMQKNPSVCFQVDEIIHLSEWKSVIIMGRYEEITDEDEKFSAEKLF